MLAIRLILGLLPSPSWVIGYLVLARILGACKPLGNLLSRQQLLPSNFCLSFFWQNLRRRRQTILMNELKNATCTLNWKKIENFSSRFASAKKVSLLEDKANKNRWLLFLQVVRFINFLKTCMTTQCQRFSTLEGNV